LKHFLRSSIRTCEDDEEYREAWERVRTRMIELGGRAWMFRAADHSGRNIEFLEWRQSAEASPLEDALLADAIDELESFGDATTEVWIED
jgi:hypothetical protein